MIETKEFAIASKEEALWLKSRDATEARIKQYKEALTIDEAFLELCKAKVKEHESDLPKTEIKEL